MSLFALMCLFAKISLFTFGGGYAMVPLFQEELVTRLGLLSPEEFADLLALAQMTPGPVGLNAATYIGYQQSGFPGALAGTFGIMLPSLVLLALAAAFFHAFRDSKLLKTALTGIRPATLGLILSAVLFFAGASIFSAELSTLWCGRADEFRVIPSACLIFGAVLLCELKWNVNILVLLFGSATAGILFSLL